MLGSTGVNSRNTVSKHVWKVVKKIAKLLPKLVSSCFDISSLSRNHYIVLTLDFLLCQVKWSHRYKCNKNLKTGYKYRTCKVTVDCTDCPINEPLPLTGARLKLFGKKDPMWFSEKMNHAGVRYEVAVCIRTGEIVWVNGPFPCGEKNDIAIFRSKLKGKLDEGEMVEADNGYGGEGKTVRKKCEYVSRADKAAKSLALARHETINSNLKKWKILSVAYCHNKDTHCIVFSAIIVPTQLGYNRGEKPFQVKYYFFGITRVNKIQVVYFIQRIS